MRLIDAELLKHEMIMESLRPLLVRRNVLGIIDDAPTIEAEPNSCEYWDSESHFCALRRPQAELVRRGRWIGIDDFPHDVWECDMCGYVYEDIPPLPHYCPNCGALMEE